MGVKEDLVELKGKLAGLREEPEKMRLFAAAGMVVLGMLLVRLPLGARLDAKVAELREAERVAAIAEKVSILRGQAELVDDRLDVPADLSDWQGYISGMVTSAGANLARQESGNLDMMYDFRKVSISLTITGTYREIWSFIDAVERGPRLARLENIDLSVSEGTLTLRCLFLGLARPATGGSVEAGEEDLA